MKIPAWYFITAILGIMLLQNLWVQKRQVEIIPYSDLPRYLEAGQVEEIIVTEQHVNGTYKLPLANGKRQFSTLRIDPNLAKDLSKYDVKLTGATEQTFFRQIIAWVLPTVVFAAIWIFFMCRFSGTGGSGGGLMSIGKSKVKVYVESDTKVTFDDVAGVDEAKLELQETVAFLKDPKTYGRLGANIPKGILLDKLGVSPSGLGVHLFNRASL